MNKFQDIINAVVAGNIDETKEVVSKALVKGIAPLDTINKGIIAGLDVVGKQFATGEMFLPEMMLSAIAAREGMVIATAGLDKSQLKPKATMVIGTIKGDLHDIGKNLVGMMLEGGGFEVVDIGIDAPP